MHPLSLVAGHVRTFDVRAHVSVRNGEFSFLDDDGLALSGTLASPVNAVGAINVPGCPAGRWWADKSGVAAVSRYGYTGR
jgi:hypothetical protein